MSVLGRCPVVPVVVLDEVEQALPLGRALLAGGIDVIEVTLRTAAGLPGIRALAELDGMHVGAGSVLTPEHVDAVAGAGARFAVSPGTSTAVIARCVERGVLPLPGAGSATDVMTCVAAGLAEVKVFPAGLLGGPAFIAALSAPFPGVRFMPSGGVKEEDVQRYLRTPNVPAVSGSWMVAPDLLRQARWDEVSRRSAAAVSLAVDAQLPDAQLPDAQLPDVRGRRLK